jgi:hypothetical protein
MTAMAAHPRLRPSNRWLYVAIAGLLATSVAIQVVRDRRWSPYVPPNPAMWIQSGPMAGKLALSFDSLVADIYWMRAVIYYGGKRGAIADGTSPAGTNNFDLLYPLLDLVTSLDPHFKVAYRFGAIFLTEAYPSGPGRPDLGISLLQRGMERDAARWEYMEDVGFIYYWWMRDFQKAAEWFKRAGEQPGAPSWLGPLAATTLAQGGDRQSSRLLWTQLLENTDVDWLRTNARRRLQQLDAMDVIDELNKRSQAFIAREGRPARDWHELAAAAGLRGIPLDPSGQAYVFDPATGKIDLDRQSTLSPLPR